MSKLALIAICVLAAVFCNSLTADAQWWGWPYYGAYSYYGGYGGWPYGGYGYGGYYGKRQAGFEPVQQPIGDSIGGATSSLPRPPTRPFYDDVEHTGQFGRH